MLYIQFHVKVPLQYMWGKLVDNYLQDLKGGNMKIVLLAFIFNLGLSIVHINFCRFFSHRFSAKTK